MSVDCLFNSESPVYEIATEREGRVQLHRFWPEDHSTGMAAYSRLTIASALELHDKGTTVRLLTFVFKFLQSLHTN
jgi:hypothetical protein